MLKDRINGVGARINEGHGSLKVAVSGQGNICSPVILFENIADGACGFDSSRDDDFTSGETAIGDKSPGFDDVDPLVELKWGLAFLQIGSRLLFFWIEKVHRHPDSKSEKSHSLKL